MMSNVSGMDCVGGGNHEVERLTRERNDLLEAGCYTVDDPVIQELDREINRYRLTSNNTIYR